MGRRQMLPLLILLILLTLIGCTSPGAASSATATPNTSITVTTAPTPASRLPDLTFIGSDGNVWEMTWPQGAPGNLPPMDTQTASTTRD